MCVCVCVCVCAVTNRKDHELFVASASPLSSSHEHFVLVAKRDSVFGAPPSAQLNVGMFNQLRPLGYNEVWCLLWSREKSLNANSFFLGLCGEDSHTSGCKPKSPTFVSNKSTWNQICTRKNTTFPVRSTVQGKTPTGNSEVQFLPKRIDFAFANSFHESVNRAESKTVSRPSRSLSDKTCGQRLGGRKQLPVATTLPVV